jgi:hypothetical protein
MNQCLWRSKPFEKRRTIADFPILRLSSLLQDGAHLLLGLQDGPIGWSKLPERPQWTMRSPR